MLAESVPLLTLINALAWPTPPALSVTTRVTVYTPPVAGVNVKVEPVVTAPCGSV